MQRTIARNKLVFALIGLLWLGFSTAFAQVGIGTTTPDASAMLDITSTSRGLLLPRMTAAQRTTIASPANGLMVYQTDAPIGIWAYVSGAWTQLGGGGGLATDMNNIAGTGVVQDIRFTGNVPRTFGILPPSLNVNGANLIIKGANAGPGLTTVSGGNIQFEVGNNAGSTPGSPGSIIIGTSITPPQPVTTGTYNVFDINPSLTVGGTNLTTLASVRGGGGSSAGATLVGLGVDLSNAGWSGATRYAATFQGGSVGIGTAAPQALLEVNQPIAGSGTAVTVSRITGNINTASQTANVNFLQIAPINGGQSMAAGIASGLSVDMGQVAVSGTGARVAATFIDGPMNVVATSGTITPGGAQANVLSYATGVGTATAQLLLATAQGQQSAPAASALGDKLGGISFRGAATGPFNLVGGALIESYATEAYTASANGGDMRFYTVANGTTPRIERMRIDQNGNVGIGTATPNATLQVNGSISNTVQSFSSTSTTTLDNNNFFYQYTSASGSLTLNLPAPSAALVGREYQVWNATTGSGVVTIGVTANGPNTVNGSAANINISTPNTGGILRCVASGVWVGMPQGSSAGGASSDLSNIVTTNIPAGANIQFAVNNNNNIGSPTIGLSNLYLAGGNLNNGIFSGATRILAHNQTTQNTLVGAAGFSNPTGSGNVLVGTNAGNSLTTGQFNTFVGASAGPTATGDQNTFLGTGAGLQVLTGSSNTLLGRGAGSLTLTTGDGNVLVGFNANAWASGTSNGVALGISATTEASAVAVGSSATASGSSSVVLGANSSATSNSSIVLGAGSSASAAGAVAIGAGVSANQASSIILGNSLYNVGIGISTPNFPLTVSVGRNTFAALIDNFGGTSSSSGLLVNIANTSATPLDVQSNGTSRLTVLGSGNVGIGTGTPNFGLEAAGSVGFSSITTVSSSPYTVVGTDFFIVVNGGVGTTIVTLPNPSAATRGRTIVVKNLITFPVNVGASGNVMVNTGAISGVANVSLLSGEQGTFISGGTFWYRIN
jgi:hypothetical protein